MSKFDFDPLTLDLALFLARKSNPIFSGKRRRDWALILPYLDSSMAKGFLWKFFIFFISAIFRRKQGVKVGSKVQTLNSPCFSKKTIFPKIIQTLFFSVWVLYLGKISAKWDYSISVPPTPFPHKKKEKKKRKGQFMDGNRYTKIWKLFTWQPQMLYWWNLPQLCISMRSSV